MYILLFPQKSVFYPSQHTIVMLLDGNGLEMGVKDGATDVICHLFVRYSVIFRLRLLVFNSCVVLNELFYFPYMIVAH